jgi:hypothetical protein
MTEVHRFRMAMCKYLGQPLTPEVAAAIEVAAFTQPDQSIDLGQFAPEQYQGLTFAAESFRAIVDELHPLHEAHYAETERARAGLALNPDYDYMAASERAGNLLQFTARMDGDLVGNIRLYLFRDLHNGTRGANEDALYLAPVARHGMNASRFVDYAERCLAKVGVVDAWADTKILHDGDGKVIRDVGVLMRRRGWDHVADKYHKRLSQPAAQADQIQGD